MRGLTIATTLSMTIESRPMRGLSKRGRCAANTARSDPQHTSSGRPGFEAQLEWETSPQVRDQGSKHTSSEKPLRGAMGGRTAPCASDDGRMAAGAAPTRLHTRIDPLVVLRAVAVCVHARVCVNVYVLAPNTLIAKRQHPDATPGHMGPSTHNPGQMSAPASFACK